MINMLMYNYYYTTTGNWGRKILPLQLRLSFDIISDCRTFRQKSAESGLANVLTVNKRCLINQRIF